MLGFTRGAFRFPEMPTLSHSVTISRERTILNDNCRQVSLKL